MIVELSATQFLGLAALALAGGVAFGIARLTGYSPAHVCYTRRGLRISRPLRAKMRELGLKPGEMAKEVK